MARQREEVLNVVLAQVISATGLAAAPESIRKARGDRAMPDVIVSLLGLRCAIEGKIGDSPDANQRALKTAKDRVATGVAHVATAVVYPAALRETAFSDLPDELRASELEFLVYTETGEENWRKGRVDDLLEDLRRSYHRLAGDDVVERSAQLLQTGMEDVVNVLMSDATSERLAELLGVHEPDE